MSAFSPPPVFAGPRASDDHLSRRRFARGRGGPVLAVVITGLIVSGCGFQPLYSDSRLSPRMSAVYVEPIADSAGYELRNALIDLLGSNGQTAGKAYRLAVTLTDTSQGVALQNDATITRYNDTLTANYVLSDDKGTELTHGSLTGLSSYNVATAPYATQSARQDADKRAALDIAQRLRLDLGVYFRRARR